MFIIKKIAAKHICLAVNAPLAKRHIRNTFQANEALNSAVKEYPEIRFGEPLEEVASFRRLKEQAASV